MISSCLKVQVGNQPSFITSFTGVNLEYAVENVGNLNDLIVFSHLYSFFGFKSEWTYVAPMISITGTPSNVLLGYTADSENSNDHPDSLSLVCFTQQSLKDELSKQLPHTDEPFVMSPQEWRTLIQSTSFEDINSVLNEALGSNEITVITENTKLKVLRCTPADMLLLPPRHSDAPSYIDAFDLVKERLASKVNLLDSNGLSPAIYHLDGDYIEFTADCAMQINFIAPPIEPTMPT